jgi:hypothetical protein
MSFRRGLLDRAIKCLNDEGFDCRTIYTGKEPELVQHKLHTNLIKPYGFQDGVVDVVKQKPTGYNCIAYWFRQDHNDL